MRAYLRSGWWAVWILSWPLLAVHAQPAAEVGDRLRLKAAHHDGVPVHPEPRGTHAFWRVPDVSEGEVEAIEQDGRWLRLDFPEHPDGWVNRRHVIRNLTEHPPTPPDEPLPDAPLTDAERVWRSPSDCLDVVESGGRLPGNDADTLRLATWNVRWFPNGCGPAQSCEENATDLEWLACTLTWLAVDAVAVREFLDDPPARTRIALTLDRLDTLTGGDWNVDLQTCGAAKSQRVGFLWNQAAVTLDDFADLADLNGAARPGGSACAGNLRPGRYARFTSPDGLETRPRP